mmetsp:Transcript_49415/g.91510  ORF Transcript_49415/g.91510 Transcript_49415/m.91510 type:complete len:229 (+) Transcript_49415:743-1429(+)
MKKIVKSIIPTPQISTKTRVKSIRFLTLSTFFFQRMYSGSLLSQFIASSISNESLPNWEGKIPSTVLASPQGGVIASSSTTFLLKFSFMGPVVWLSVAESLADKELPASCGSILTRLISPDSLLTAVVPSPAVSSSRTSVAMWSPIAESSSFCESPVVGEPSSRVPALEADSDGVRPFSSAGGGGSGGIAPERHPARFFPRHFSTARTIDHTANTTNIMTALAIAPMR